jgi:hypothetical protein
MMFGQFVMVEYDDQLYYTKVAAGRLAGMENSAPPRRHAALSLAIRICMIFVGGALGSSSH